MTGQSHCGRRLASGYTLVELLVTISILVLLMALLTPAMSSAREAARSTQCLSNLRGLGSAFLLYAATSRGYLPPQALNHALDDATYKLAPYQSYPYSFSYVMPVARLAYQGLIPHVTVEAGDRGNAVQIWNRERSLRVCPTLVGESPQKLLQPFLGDNFSHYISDVDVVGRYHNTSLPLGDPAAWSTTAKTRRVNAIQKPAQVMSLADTRYWVKGNPYPDNGFETVSFLGNYSPSRPGTNTSGDNGHFPYEGATAKLEGFRHRNKGCNFVFLDGHGEFRQWQGDLAAWKTTAGYGKYMWMQQ